MGVCGRCGQQNPESLQTCASCGERLGPPCPSCGVVARPTARYCDACGSELAAPGAQGRKVVTVLFADLVGSTAAQETMDPESVRRWMDRFNAVLRSQVEDQGGRVVKFTGDGVMALFGVPDVREDDARRALTAALAMHAAVAELTADVASRVDGPVALRVGVNTGEVVVTSSNDDVVGDVVNVAARLEQAAAPGQVLVGEATFRLVRLGALLRALPPLELKGKVEPVNAFQLLSLTPAAEAVPTSPFVGRTVELERLTRTLDAVIKDRRAHLASIVGAPGVGKSRLTRQLGIAAAGRARVIDIRCEPAGAGTFAPIAAVLRAAASLRDDASDDTVLAALTALFDDREPDRDRIATTAAALLGVGQPGSPEESFWAVRRLLENAARTRPLVVVVDDIQWAHPLLLDLIEHLAEWIREVPVFLVVAARPELWDLRPGLLEGGERVHVVIHLEGLPAADSRRLTEQLLGGADLPDAFVDRVVTASEGNPLFVGELVRMLVDDGVLRHEKARWVATVDVAAVELPLSIHALLAARIDRLTPGERAVLEAASVMGRTFHRGAVAELVGPEIAVELDGHLEGLRGKDLVEPTGTLWLDEPGLRFHHALIRDAAYRRLLREDRARLHERAARWLEAKVGDLVEHDDVIGYQLEQAHLLRSEAGSVEVALGRAAAERLAAAGHRALDADDRPVAASLLGRALACLPSDDPERAELLLERCEALLGMGDVTSAVPAIDELASLANDSRRLGAWVACFAGELANLRDPAQLAATAEAAADAAATLAALGDDAGEAKAHAVRATSLGRLGRIEECEHSLDKALVAARAAGVRRRATAILGGAPIVALWGPSPVSRASAQCLDVVRVLRTAGRTPSVESTSLRCQAVLEALRGQADAARHLIASARRSLEDLGHAHGLLELDLAAGMVELLTGEPTAAEPYLRHALAGLQGLGIGADAALASALLARVRIVQGAASVALDLTAESRRLGGDDLKTGITWRAVQAEALAHRGEFVEARRLAEEAVALAEPTDALIDHADALVALAEVHRLSGDRDAAAVTATRAVDIYERKEATAPALATRSRFGLPVPETPSPTNTPATSTDHVAGDRSLENEVTQFCAAWVPTLFSRDWTALGRLFASDIAGMDHRPLVGGDPIVGRDATVAGNRGVVEVGVTSLVLTPVALRGDRWALMRAEYGGPTGGLVVLQLLGLNREGQLLRSEVFELAQLDEALVRLDKLHAKY